MLNDGACLEKTVHLYLAQRCADFLIAVKHGLRKGFRLIRDRLTYRRRIPWHTSKREVKRGRDITWDLRAMPAPEWVMEQWPGSATIIAVRSHGTREGKPQDETVPTSRVCALVPKPCSKRSGSAGRLRTAGTGCGMCR
jgi:hypothetical protein